MAKNRYKFVSFHVMFLITVVLGGGGEQGKGRERRT